MRKTKRVRAFVREDVYDDVKLFYKNNLVPFTDVKVVVEKIPTTVFRILDGNGDLVQTIPSDYWDPPRTPDETILMINEEVYKKLDDLNQNRELYID